MVGFGHVHIGRYGQISSDGVLAKSAHPNRITVPVAAGPSLLYPDRFAPSKRRHLSAPGLRTFLIIADRWGWTAAKRLLVLGSPSRSTYFGWAAKVRAGQDLTLPVDVPLRVSAILGIHKALMILFGSEPAAVDWLTGPHEGPPMALATNGTMDGPMLARRYLDAARRGVFGPPGPIDEAVRRAGQSAGIAYDSLCHRGGIDAVAYRPRLTLEVTQADHYEITAPVGGAVVVRRQ